MIDEEIKRIVLTCYERAKNILLQNRDVVDKTAKLLLEKETIDGNQIDALLNAKKGELASDEISVTNNNRLTVKIKDIGVDPYAYYLVNKGIPVNLSISGVSPCQANIIKQESLAVGIDTAVARGVANCSKDTSELCILAHRHGLKTNRKIKIATIWFKRN